MADSYMSGTIKELAVVTYFDGSAVGVSLGLYNPFAQNVVLGGWSRGTRRRQNLSTGYGSTIVPLAVNDTKRVG